MVIRNTFKLVERFRFVFELPFLVASGIAAVVAALTSAIGVIDRLPVAWQIPYIAGVLVLAYGAVRILYFVLGPGVVRLRASLGAIDAQTNDTEVTVCHRDHLDPETGRMALWMQEIESLESSPDGYLIS